MVIPIDEFKKQKRFSAGQTPPTSAPPDHDPPPAALALAA
jgi:hypothetical protein